MEGGFAENGEVLIEILVGKIAADEDAVDFTVLASEILESVGLLAFFEKLEEPFEVEAGGGADDETFTGEGHGEGEGVVGADFFEGIERGLPWELDWGEEGVGARSWDSVARRGADSNNVDGGFGGFEVGTDPSQGPWKIFLEVISVEIGQNHTRCTKASSEDIEMWELLEKLRPGPTGMCFRILEIS